MNHDDIVSDWRHNAEPNDERNYKFLRSLKFRKYDFRPDELASELHAEAFQIIDCTRCANCCKSMEVYLTRTDIARIARRLQVSVAELIASHLELDPEAGGRYRIRQQPCTFLGEDDRCTIYDVRPRACREFPHTDKKGFAARTHLHADNALMCPAVFWIVEQMRRRARK